MPRPPQHYQHVIRALDDLRPFGKNPRHHPESQIRKLKAAIKTLGFTNPIIIDEAGAVLAGYGRVIAARELKLLNVPCIVVTGLNSAQKQALMVSDNKIAEEAKWDSDLLIETLGEISFAGVDTTLTGFDTAEIDAMLSPMELPIAEDDPESGPDHAKSPAITVTVTSQIEIPSVAAILRKAIKAAGLKNVRVREPR